MEDKKDQFNIKFDFSNKPGSNNVRYGADELSFAITGLALACMAISTYCNIDWLMFVAIFMLISAAMRMMSTKTEARQAENDKFKKIFAGKDSKYTYLKCPKCHQKVRVPKGKGKIRVTCPSCDNKFEVES